jgi:hypothetical protein
VGSGVQQSAAEERIKNVHPMLVNRRRCDAEVALQVGFGRRPSEHLCVGAAAVSEAAFVSPTTDRL